MRWEIHRESGSCVLLMDLEFLSAAEERAATGVWDRRTLEINQPGYSKNVLTLKQNSKNALLWRRRFACIYFHRKQEAVASFRIDIDQV